ncbi:hypothetical protein FOMPIDRAFT_157411 [Fomitopsis schrenkii]|uniref:Mixed lineage kinase domain-containing protein n=1 Tax=Fomitopsis schrenkii TaxID=2126942 RepID=S8F6M8_FOMSC|nr:hypothetical protein FOMPIDRAFT_157411 [Fomitopsis schrenkii]
MPLVTAEDVLQLAVDVAAATKELSNLASFTPAAIASGILLEIFKTIQQIQTNKADCHRLALRCLSLLRRVHDQMVGRWEDSPPSLVKALKAFEATLETIQVFLINEASKSWHARLRRKRSIEQALHSFSVRLGDAERSFQISTLINIHYAVGDKDTVAVPRDTKIDGSNLYHPHASSSKDSLDEKAGLKKYNVSPPVEGLCLESSNQSGTPKHAMAHSTAPTGQLGPPAASTPAPGSLRDAAVASDAAVVEDVEASYSSFLAVQMPEIVSPKISSRRRERQPVVDDDGFRRYHQSDLLLRGLSRTRERWWAGTAQAEVDGQSVIVKRYEGPREGALERWKGDVEVLRRYRGGEMARMLGYSQDSCTTPFIVLASAPLRLPEGL